ncbi:uncharacterized protein LOC119670976 isoform X2 [Teleopsis dalmanni]|uniref:uncharacterized protein LOC119670976 isoform X2 n=1 Tax=Teleopsis dalmanni TaxID=139649 RepID=UPI0018CDE967|nr:uncharacterized protein LOC119670976 isoform X2 [Teleopsis dalmanni]
MTFYWWSHWFWITLLSNILLFITIVHTYPSQEISLDYNQNTGAQKTVTKLYQTTAILTWATATPSQDKNLEHTTTPQKTVLQNVTPSIRSVETLLSTEDETQNKIVDKIDLEIDDEPSNPDKTDIEDITMDDDVDAESGDYNNGDAFKRSAEIQNKTKDLPVEETKSADDSKKQTTNNFVKVKLQRDEAPSLLNNYTNFSSAISTNNKNNATLENLANVSISQPTVATQATPDADAASKQHDSESSHSTIVQWFNVMTAQLPPTLATANINEVTVTTAQKVAPFTLENANREDELRRAETEHRSRKSKVLSAEYRYNNRYINYSSDSKSLLARSASTAPSDFDAEESNISSEALAIQRTYFLDAGAISAICFTVFGVCCTIGTIGIVLYRRRYLNKPQALSEPDSSVYIDDSTMRDNSDEMYSLDNDSFLNSLEAMTIQNYWTDTVKHTKL